MGRPSRYSDTHIINRHIAQQIRARRLRLGLTLVQVSDALGISYQQLHKNETGLNDVPASRLYDLARLFDVAIGFFFQGLHDEQIVPRKRADMRFLPLAMAFLRLKEEDQAILVRVARQFSDRRGRPK